MNEGQRRRVLIEMERAIIFPPIYELDNKVIELFVPLILSRDSEKPPHLIQFELIRISADGKVISRKSAEYIHDQR